MVIPSGGDVPPAQIELVPAGEIPTRRHDSRQPWRNENPEAVIAATNAENGGEFQVNFDHQPGPAAGWVGRLFIRDGAIWAEVEWTERAAEMIQKKEYRFISPEFLFDKQRRVVQLITGAALTNDPALYMKAIANSQAYPSGEFGEFVPRAEFDRVSADLVALRSGTTQASAAAMVDHAITAGKLTPGCRDWALSYAASDAGGFGEFIKATPTILKPGRLLPNGRPPAHAGGALTEEEMAVCRAMNVTENQFLESRKQLQALPSD